MLEVVAVSFPGAHSAERELSGLRSTRSDAWLSEASVIERDPDGRYSVKAKNPSLTADQKGTGAAVGGLTGLFIGIIGGPLGLLFWGAVGAVTGGAIGARHKSAFKPMIDELEARLAPDSSMLLLVGESTTADDFERALQPSADRLVREQLTSDQEEELTKAIGERR